MQTEHRRLFKRARRVEPIVPMEGVHLLGHGVVPIGLGQHDPPAVWDRGSASPTPGAGERPGMATWRDHVFSWMSRNATRATDFFNIPINRVVELGTHVDI